MTINLDNLSEKLHSMDAAELTGTLEDTLEQSGIPYTRTAEPGIVWTPLELHRYGYIDTVYAAGTLDYSAKLTLDAPVGTSRMVSDLRAHMICNEILDDLPASITELLEKGKVEYNTIPGGWYSTVSWVFDAGTMPASEFELLVESISHVAAEHLYPILVKPQVSGVSVATKFSVTVIKDRITHLVSGFNPGRTV